MRSSTVQPILVEGNVHPALVTRSYHSLEQSAVSLRTHAHPIPVEVYRLLDINLFARVHARTPEKKWKARTREAMAQTISSASRIIALDASPYTLAVRGRTRVRTRVRFTDDARRRAHPRGAAADAPPFRTGVDGMLAPPREGDRLPTFRFRIRRILFERKDARHVVYRRGTYRTRKRFGDG